MTFLITSKQTISNAKTLCDRFVELGYDIVTGGTDTHIVLIDLSSKNISGKKAERVLEECLITTNKNMVPYDKKSPLITSGIRIGTPALTTRGMKENEMVIIADIIHDILSDIDNSSTIISNKSKVLELCENFPLYKELEHAMS